MNACYACKCACIQTQLNTPNLRSNLFLGLIVCELFNDTSMFLYKSPWVSATECTSCRRQQSLITWYFSLRQAAESRIRHSLTEVGININNPVTVFFSQSQPSQILEFFFLKCWHKIHCKMKELIWRCGSSGQWGVSTAVFSRRSELFREMWSSPDMVSTDLKCKSIAQFSSFPRCVISSEHWQQSLVFSFLETVSVYSQAHLARVKFPWA